MELLRIVCNIIALRLKIFQGITVEETIRLKSTSLDAMPGKELWHDSALNVKSSCVRIAERYAFSKLHLCGCNWQVTFENFSVKVHAFESAAFRFSFWTSTETKYISDCTSWGIKKKVFVKSGDPMTACLFVLSSNRTSLFGCVKKNRYPLILFQKIWNLMKNVAMRWCPSQHFDSFILELTVHSQPRIYNCFE